MGSTEAELQRIMSQARVLAPMSERMLVAAGLSKGMRVLDAGCGPGGLSLLAAKLVGSDGSVIGIDRDARSIHVAMRNAAAEGATNTRFCVAQLSDASFDFRFDAVIGRLILIHLPDPVAALRQLASFVRPGGLLAFIEVDLVSPAVSWPAVPLFAQTVKWIYETMAKLVEPAAGLTMPAKFAAAGLPGPSLLSERLTGYGPDSPLYDYVAETIRSIMPAGIRAGFYTAEEVDIDTLADRLRRESVERNAAITTPTFVCGFTRKPVV
jgi:ubiquinone/menaquinone biosynthesis C-methylase UbiE